MLIAGGSLTNALTAVMLSILLPWPPDPVLTPCFSFKPVTPSSTSSS